MIIYLASSGLSHTNAFPQANCKAFRATGTLHWITSKTSLTPRGSVNSLQQNAYYRSFYHLWLEPFQSTLTEACSCQKNGLLEICVNTILATMIVMYVCLDRSPTYTYMTISAWQKQTRQFSIWCHLSFSFIGCTSKIDSGRKVSGARRCSFR